MTAEGEREDLARALALVEAGDARTALSLVRTQLGWPRGREITDLTSWMRLLADVAGKLGAVSLAEVAASAVRDPDSPDRLYDLGYALIDAGAPSIAAGVLWHCLKLVEDSEEVVCELVSALESALAYGDAFAILEEHAALRSRSFLCEYLYAFNAAMTGRLETTRTVLARLAPDSEETESMRTTIAAIVERADRIAGVSPLDAKDLRGWQYVLTGSLVLHQSPYGFDAPMHGRYAWLQDSYSRILHGIDRLAPLARTLRVGCVYAAPGRDHEILAHAVAARLGLPLAPWPAIGTPAPGLVVVYDLAELAGADLAKLALRRDDQILFAHASPWTRDLPIAPDVTTLLCQSVVPPWGEATVVDPATRESSIAPADARSVEEIAQELLASPALHADESIADDPDRWSALVERTWPLVPGLRARLWAGGPVPSNRFD